MSPVMYGYIFLSGRERTFSTYPNIFVDIFITVVMSSNFALVKVGVMSETHESRT